MEGLGGMPQGFTQTQVTGLQAVAMVHFFQEYLEYAGESVQKPIRPTTIVQV